jgi:hypothetical protein
VSDEILFEIQRSLGRIEAKIDGNAATLTQHVADDKVVARALFERIETLQLDHARQKGAARVWGMVGAIGGALLGAAGSYFGNRH